MAVLMTVLLLMSMGLSWTAAVGAQFYSGLACLKLFNETMADCKNYSDPPTPAQLHHWSNVTTEANNESSLISVVVAVVQAVACPILCTLADSVGRKLVFTVNAVLSACYMLSFAVLPHGQFYAYGPYVMGATGLSGGLFCTLAVVFSMVADVTAPLPPKQRTAMFGLVESVRASLLCMHAVWKEKNIRKKAGDDIPVHPVSYTHLTLPTIYSV